MSQQSNQVLRATLDVPFECAFKKAATMNSLPTYRVPPIPTIQGMIYSAMGRPSLLLKSKMEKEEKFREEVQQNCRFGIRVLEEGIQHEGLKSRHKTRKKEEVDKGKTKYLTYVANAETLISPKYRVYVSGPEDLLREMKEALDEPKRLLYLGRSDDIVDITNISLSDMEYVNESEELDCVVPNATGDPSLLPIEPDKRDGRTNKPARVRTVSVSGGEVDGYYQSEDGEEFVFIT